MSVQGEKLKAIADAIRAKKGSSEPIVANDFASEILSIPTGIEPSGTIDITENGVYDVAEYASANVNVSGGGSGEENANIYKLEQVQNETGNYTLNIRLYNPEVDTLENVYVVGQARGNLYVPDNVYQLYLTEVKY